MTVVYDLVQVWERWRRSTFDLLRGAMLFRNCRTRRLYATGYVYVANKGAVRIGTRSTFLGGIQPTQLVCHRGGHLEIGAHCLFNYGVVVDARQSIRIGNRCMLAAGVCLRDTLDEKAGPIVLHDNVWIAHGATVMPGVTVGEGSVVAAGSVVATDVPPRTLALGNPARLVPLATMDRA